MVDCLSTGTFAFCSSIGAVDIFACIVLTMFTRSYKMLWGRSDMRSQKSKDLFSKIVEHSINLQFYWLQPSKRKPGLIEVQVRSTAPPVATCKARANKFFKKKKVLISFIISQDGEIINQARLNVDKRKK